MAKNNKQQWKNEILHLFETLIRDQIFYRLTSKEIRLLILENPLEEKRVGACVTSTYKENQIYEFWVREDSGVIEICVYQEHMSSKNSGKSCVIIEKQPISTLSVEQCYYYRYVMTSFLMANIVWK